LHAILTEAIVHRKPQFPEFRATFKSIGAQDWWGGRLAHIGIECHWESTTAIGFIGHGSLPRDHAAPE
jgi:hypothetical protein